MRRALSWLGRGWDDLTHVGGAGLAHGALIADARRRAPDARQQPPVPHGRGGHGIPAGRPGDDHRPVRARTAARGAPAARLRRVAAGAHAQPRRADAFRRRSGARGAAVVRALRGVARVSAQHFGAESRRRAVGRRGAARRRADARLPRLWRGARRDGVCRIGGGRAAHHRAPCRRGGGDRARACASPSPTCRRCCCGRRSSSD